MNRRQLVLCALALLINVRVLAQPPAPVSPPRPETSPAADTSLIELKFDQEIELKALVDLRQSTTRNQLSVQRRTTSRTRKSPIKGPGRIPTSSLMGLLQSALKMKDLTVVDGDAPGWKRIEDATKLPQLARAGNAAAIIKQQGEFGAASAVTQVFFLKHVDPTQLDLSIKPFLSLPGANSVAFKDQGVLIVTDFAGNLVKISKLIELLDNPKPEVFTELVPLIHAQAAILSAQISQMLSARHQATDPVGTTVPSSDDVIAVGHDVRTNQLVSDWQPQADPENEGACACLGYAAGSNHRSL